MFIEVDGKREDAKLHNSILKKGVDDPAAIRKRGKALGLTDEQLDLVYPNTVSK